ncbi:alpha/beta fold hydrolase [Kocuria sp.]|uniref:alpha/beta fold hydrolase n=1 Tax=Kocuria sp. TaxID=1871328 RepID=UPI0026DFF3FC|nr:alpha/beta hydrolase [Kocuria sp.]MDO5619639.1 alpha/beta hydrolase [Kocuria sp.]
MEYAVTDVHVDTYRGRFAVRAVGNPGGQIVIAVHGFADHPASFDQLGRHLAGHGYVTVAPYLRGHVPSPMTGGMSIQDHAADVRALARELSPDQAVRLVGHGEGAWIVHQALVQDRVGVTPADQELAGDDELQITPIDGTPESPRIGPTVLLGSPEPPVVRGLLLRHPGLAWSMRHLALRRTGRWGQEQIRRNEFAALPHLWRRWSPGNHMPAHHAQRVRDMYTHSMPHPLNLLDLPSAAATTEHTGQSVLCIMGKNDAAIPPHLLPGRHARATTSQLIVIGNAGHFPHLEAPDATFAAVTAWFADRSLAEVSGQSV